MTDRPPDDGDAVSTDAADAGGATVERLDDARRPARREIEEIRTLDDTGPRRAHESPRAELDRDPIERMRRSQRIIRLVAGVVLLGTAYVAVSVFQVWSTGETDDRGPVDAIVVMGAAQFDGRPSPQLAARLDHVLELWPDGVAPLVVTTGGNQPGDRFTEAESSAQYLVDRGVPREAILLEDAGRTTYESMEGVAELLDGRELSEIVIVTDPYHALRSRLIAESLGLDATTSSTDTSVVTGSDATQRHLVEGVGVAVGRIIGFERLDRWTN
ncbi:MAG: YdcF family protein [Actinomycetota bacterium]